MRWMTWFFATMLVFMACGSSFAEWKVEGSKIVRYEDSDTKKFQETDISKCDFDSTDECWGIMNRRMVLYENRDGQKIDETYVSKCSECLFCPDEECWGYQDDDDDNDVIIYRRGLPERLQEIEFPVDVISGELALKIKDGDEENPYSIMNEDVQGSSRMDFEGSVTEWKLKKVQYVTYYPEDSYFNVSEVETVKSVVSSATSVWFGIIAFILKYVMQIGLFGMFLYILSTEYAVAPTITNDFYIKIKGRWARIFFKFEGLGPNSRIAIVIFLLTLSICLPELVTGGAAIIFLLLVIFSVLAGFFVLCAEEVSWESVCKVSAILGIFLLFAIGVNSGSVTNYAAFFIRSAAEVWLLANFVYFTVKYLFLRKEKNSEEAGEKG
ncbi:hypothetical protein ACFL16_00755 [Patescibacteria group bacterium]